MSSATYSLDTPALTCWKDIAHYFGKGVRTVQRWERELGLPVKRPQGALGNSLKSPVLADPRDLDAWLQSRWAFRPVKEPVQILPPVVISDRSGSLGPGIEQARKLRLRMHAMQVEHRQLMVDLTESVRTLTETCQKMQATRIPHS